MRMNILSFMPAAMLLLSITACSSGSSTAPTEQTSTNLVPADTNVGTSDQIEPSENQSDNTASSDNDTSDTTNAMPSEDATGNEDGTDTLAETDGTTESEGNDTNETGSTINPESSLGQLQSRIQSLTGSAIADLNTTLNQGEMLSLQENECVGSFDPALGEPLLTINCEEPLAVNNVLIYLTSALLEDSTACRSDLQNNNADNCVVVKADLTVNTLFVIPPTAQGQPERPIPKAGAKMSFDAAAGVLSFQNLPAALAGVFMCEYDLNSGDVVSSSNSANCDQQANAISELIDEHLANQRL